MAQDSGIGQFVMVILVIGFISIAACCGLTFSIWADGNPYLVIANTSDSETLAIYLDGEPLTQLAISDENREDSIFQERVGAGVHQIVAKNAAGEEIDSREINVESGGDLWYYNPTPDGPSGLCLYKQVAEYGVSFAGLGGAPLPERLDEPFGNFGDVDQWFEEPPDEVSVPEGSSTATRIAVRLRPCIEPGIY